jgi:hypothetical protein
VVCKEASVPDLTSDIYAPNSPEMILPTISA